MSNLLGALTRLSTEDGGFSGLPALYVLKEIFDRLAYDLEVDYEIKPCDIFHMIIGIGKGGLDALLLGRLKMTVSQAIAAYSEVSDALPSRPAESEEKLKQNDQQFESAFTKLLKDSGFPAETPLREDDSSCSTVLITLNTAGAGVYEPLRTYRSRKQPSPPCTILDAARAVISSPGYFSPVKIGETHDFRSVLDASIVHENPIKDLLRQARDRYQNDKEVATIISLGSTNPRLHPLSSAKSQARPDPIKEAMRQMGPDGEREHTEIYQRLKNVGVYYRFSVDCSLIDDTERVMEMIQVKSKKYLEQEEISDLVDKAVQSLRLREPKISLKRISSIDVMPTTLRTPPTLVKNFIGRDDILRSLYFGHFDNQVEKSSGPIISALTGLGGVGKTQISIRFLEEFRSRFPTHAIYFVDARSKEQLDGDLQTIIRALGEGYQSATYIDALAWLSGVQKEWLIIYDNADDLSLRLHLYIPKSNLGHAIISSRNYDIRELCPGNHYHIGELTPREAIDLLLASSHTPHTEKNEELASGVVSALGFLPLAIAHAASYIYRHDCLDDFASMYQKRTQKVMSQVPNAVPDDYSLSVATTIEMSFDRLSQQARDFLTLLAFFHITGVSRDMFAVAATRGFDYVNFPLRTSKPPEIAQLADRLKTLLTPTGSWSEYDFNELIKECRHYSLLGETKTAEGTRFYSMHLLVHTWLQDRQTQEKKKEYYSLVARVLSSYTSKEAIDKYWPQSRILLRHARSIPLDTPIIPEDNYQLAWIFVDWGDHLTGKTRSEKVLHEINSCAEADVVQVSKVLRALSMYEYALSQYQQASERARAALDIQSEVLGEEHEETMMTTAALGDAIHYLGKYEEAFQLRKQLLSKSEIRLGKEHTQTQEAMLSVAESLKTLGRYQDALDIETRLLEIRKRTYSDEHPDTISTMENLADTLTYQSKYSEALDIKAKVVELRRKVYGPDDIGTLSAMLNQSVSLMELKRFEEALAMQFHVLDAQKKELGDAHPNALTTMTTIRSTLIHLIRYEEAMDICGQMVEKQKQLYGPDNIVTLAAIRLLADTLIILGRFQESLDLQTNTLRKLEELVGEEYPETLLAMDTMSSTFSILSRYQEELNLRERIMDIRRRTLGEEHRETLSATAALASVLSRVRRHQEGLELHNKVFDIRNRVLGPEHPETLLSIEDIAGSLMQLGRYQEALRIIQPGLEVRIKVSGPEDRHTLLMLTTHAWLLVNLGRCEEALDQYQKLLELKIRIRGENHYEVALLLVSYGCALSRMGRYQDGLSEQRKGLEGVKAFFGVDHRLAFVQAGEMAWSLFKLGQYQEAYALRADCLEKLKILLGDDDIETFMAMSDLALSFSQLGRHQEALEMHQKALEGQKHLFGEKHPRTWTIMNRIAGVLYDLQRYDEALPFEREVVEMRRKELGGRHIRTVFAMENLADILSELGHGEEEVQIREEVKKIREEVKKIREES